MFLIYRNRSANIGIEMKLKKLSPKMIKDYARLFERKKKGKNWSAWLQIFQKTENE